MLLIKQSGTFPFNRLICPSLPKDESNEEVLVFYRYMLAIVGKLSKSELVVVPV